MCTFVSCTVHRLQRVHRDCSERARALPTGLFGSPRGGRVLAPVLALETNRNLRELTPHWWAERAECVRQRGVRRPTEPDRVMPS
jgi:hypothetical protein